MNKRKTIVLMLLTVVTLCFALTGCSLQNKIEEFSSDKEQCFLNTENVTQFTYKGDNYTVLEETVPNSGLGDITKLFCMKISKIQILSLTSKTRGSL